MEQKPLRLKGFKDSTSREITPERIEVYLEDYPNFYTALQRQNWYTYTEALEDLTALVNEIVKASKNE